MDNKTNIFLEVIDNHKRIIYKITNSYCKQNEDRQDLIQEIIIQLWQSFDKYNPQYSFSTWVYRIALNTSISYYRKNKIRKEKTTELSVIAEASLKASEPFQENPSLSILQNFIKELKEIDKALMLLYLDGLSHKEIAKIIGITSSNVSTKLTRIKKQLKQKFVTVKNQYNER